MFNVTATGVYLQADATAYNQDITGSAYIYNGGSLTPDEVLFLLAMPRAGVPMPPTSEALQARRVSLDEQREVVRRRAEMNRNATFEIKGKSMSPEECAQLARHQRTLADAELARMSAEDRRELAAIVNSDPDYSNEKHHGLEVTPDKLDEDVENAGATMMRDGIIYSHRTLRPTERAAQIKDRRFHGIEDILLDENGRRRNKDGSARRPRRVRAKNRK